MNKPNRQIYLQLGGPSAGGQNFLRSDQQNAAVQGAQKTIVDLNTLAQNQQKAGAGKQVTLPGGATYVMQGASSGTPVQHADQSHLTADQFNANSDALNQAYTGTPMSVVPSGNPTAPGSNPASHVGVAGGAGLPGVGVPTASMTPPPTAFAGNTQFPQTPAQATPQVPQMSAPMSAPQTPAPAQPDQGTPQSSPAAIPAPNQITPVTGSTTAAAPVTPQMPGSQQNQAIPPQQTQPVSGPIAPAGSTPPQPTGTLPTINGIDFHQLGTGTMAEFAGQQINAYQSMIADLQNITMQQIGTSKQQTDAMIDQLTKQQNLYDIERQASIAQIQSNAGHMQDVAVQQEDVALKTNELSNLRNQASMDSQIAVSQDNNSRLMGFMQGKFAAAGMDDSSAGLQLIGKYMASSQLALNQLIGQKSMAQQDYLNNQQKILTDYFNQSYQIENDRVTKTNDINFKMMDAIQGIQKDKLTSISAQNTFTLSALKDFSTQKLSIQQAIGATITNLASQSLEQMKFQHQVTYDAANLSLQDKKATLEASQFEWTKDYQTQSLGLQKDQLDFQKATTGEWAPQFNPTTGEFGYFNNKTAEFRSPDQMTGSNTSDDTSTTGGTANSDGTYTPAPGVITQNADGSVKINAKTGDIGGQCGHFINQRTGLGFGDSYQSKIEKCDPNIKDPQPGDVFVMPIKGQDNGHTGFIESVTADKNGREIATVTDSNWHNDGKVLTHQIPIDEMKGFVRPSGGKQENLSGPGQEVQSVFGDNENSQQVRQQNNQQPTPPTTETPQKADVFDSMPGTKNWSDQAKQDLSYYGDQAINTGIPPNSGDHVYDRMVNMYIQNKTGGLGIVPAADREKIVSMAKAQDTSPVTTAFQNTKIAYDTLPKLGNSASDTQQLLQLYGSVINPGADISKPTGLDQIKNDLMSKLSQSGLKVKDVFTATGGLTKDAKKQVINTITKDYQTRLTEYKQTYKQYADQIRQAYPQVKDISKYLPDYSGQTDAIRTKAKAEGWSDKEISDYLSNS